MVFSTNQVRQFYVSKEDHKAEVAFTSDNKSAYIKHVNALSEPVRSDLIHLDTITSMTITAPQQTPIKSVEVTLSEECNGGNPIPGQDYILNIFISQFVGISDTDVYIKQGMVRATKSMEKDKSKFYKTLACSLFMNFKREAYPLLKFALGEQTVDEVKRDPATGALIPYSKGAGGALTEITDATKVVITEAEQEWRLGVKEQTSVLFEVHPTTVMDGGIETTWGVATKGTAGTRGNGKTIADLEYFCMGERGDIYRGIGWPHNITTEYLVEPAKDYYTLDIHHSHVGDGENPQKSEKDITIVCVNEQDLTEIKNAIEAHMNPTTSTGTEQQDVKTQLDDIL